MLPKLEQGGMLFSRPVIDDDQSLHLRGQHRQALDEAGVRVEAHHHCAAAREYRRQGSGRFGGGRVARSHAGSRSSTPSSKKFGFPDLACQ